MSDGPCIECGSEEVTRIEDGPLGDAEGAYTLVCAACPAEFYVPGVAPGSSRIEQLRGILSTHGAACIDGMIVDVQTANALVTLYDALSPEQRDRFGAPPLDRLATLAWKACA